MSPLFSIVIPVYNCEPFLQESMSSVLNQTLQDFEVILIDDNSTDNSLKILQKINDSRFKIISLEKNFGVAHALNVGISESKADFIVRFDADDYMMPNRLEMQYAFLCAHPEVDVLGCAFESFETGETWIPPLSHDEIVCNLLFGCPLCHPSVVLKKRIFSLVGGYTEGLPAEDYALWIDLLLQTKVKFANQSVVLLKRRTFPNRHPNYYENSYHCSKRLRHNILKHFGFSDDQETIDIHERILNTCLIESNDDFLARMQHVFKIYNSNLEFKLFDNKTLYFLLWNYISLTHQAYCIYLERNTKQLQ